jgi:hypothetical protein
MKHALDMKYSSQDVIAIDAEKPLSELIVEIALYAQ